MAEMAQVASGGSGLDLLRGIASTDTGSASREDIYPAMLAFAAACQKHDMIQTVADTLAFLLQYPDVGTSVRDEAAEIFNELESRICPRVILDARVFADGMDLTTMLEYLLEHFKPDTT